MPASARARPSGTRSASSPTRGRPAPRSQRSRGRSSTSRCPRTSTAPVAPRAAATAPTTSSGSTTLSASSRYSAARTTHQASQAATARGAPCEGMTPPGVPALHGRHAFVSRRPDRCNSGRGAELQPPMHRIHAVLIVLALAALGAPATASASHRQFTIFEANRELRSDDAQLRAQTLDEIRAFGVRWVRVLMYWRDVAPQASSATWPGFDERSPAGYDWHVYDRIVAEARARGLHVLLTPTGPAPRWATYGRHNGVDHPSPGHFERFMQAAGTRYRDTVSAWSIWNEPNHPDFLGPQFRHGRPYSPRIYRKLFQAAMRGLRKSGNRHDRVLMGETAPRGNRHVVAPLAFLR